MTADGRELKVFYRVLFVCTGNTCRSPLAEVLCKLARPEWEARSRGVAAFGGAGAAEYSQEIAGEYGCDLSGHRAGLVTEGDMEWADTVYGLTAGHTQILRRQFPNFEGKVKELPGGDVPDPIGGTLEDYRACAERLLEEMARL